MLGRADEARDWLGRAAAAYRESWTGAPPGSWGRPIGELKARLLAGDDEGAAAGAIWALDEGAGEADSPIGRYAAALALLVLDRPEGARVHAERLRGRDDFPQDVADAVAALAAGEVAGYTTAVRAVLESFETRNDYLEDVPVADTVLVLQALAARRGLAVELASPLLP